MRVSPASSLSQAHASHHAAQPTNATKADEPSPFAQLVAATAPDEKKPAQSQARPDKAADDTPRDEKSPASKNAASVGDARSQANAASQPAEPAAPDSQDNPQIQNEKPMLADVTGNTAPVVDAQAGDPALIAQPVAQPAPPPVASPLPSLPIALAANENGAPEETGTAPVPDAAPPSMLPVLAEEAAPQTTPPQTASPQAATPQTVTSQAATPQLEAVSPPAAASTQAQSADTAAPKMPESAVPISQTTETAAPKPQTDAAENKGGAINNAAPDSPKPDVVQTAIIETATPKAVAPPQAAPASNTNMAVQATPTQPANAPAAHLTQHVEVSAEARPNMPSLAVEIAARSQSGARQFDIRLDPPELGRVDVRLSIDAAGKASAHLSADQPQTLDLLQRDAAVLTRALRDAGLDVSQNSLNFSLRHQSQDGSAHRGNPRTVSRAMALNATHTIEATSASTAIRGDGRLDIRV